MQWTEIDGDGAAGPRRGWRRRRCAVRLSRARRGAASDGHDGFAVRGRPAAHCSRACRRAPDKGARTRGGRGPAPGGGRRGRAGPGAVGGVRTVHGCGCPQRARTSAGAARGNSRPCCRGPEGGRGEHTGKRPRAVGGGAAGGRAASGREDGLAPPCAHSPARCVAASARAHIASTNSCRTSTGPLSTCTAQRLARAGACR